MFGFYETYPQNVHKIRHFATLISNKRLQQTLIQLFRDLNKETLRLKDVGTPSLRDWNTFFELGIAEDNGFSYLDDEESTKALKIIQRTPLRILDFLCAVRYYRIVGERRKPLKFDYYMLRFTFNPKFLELQLFHERGPMHILPEEFVDFMIKKINQAFHRRVLRSLKEE